MASVMRLPRPIPADRDKDWHCVCGHFNDEVEPYRYVSFCFDGDLEDLEDYIDANVEVDEFSKCPDCGTCCSTRNGDLHERGCECDKDPDRDDDDEAQWLCAGCAKVHESEEDALACCP